MPTRKIAAKEQGAKKLTPRQKKIASEYIAEEKRTGKYSSRQSVAIGISRARAATKRSHEK